MKHLLLNILFLFCVIVPFSGCSSSGAKQYIRIEGFAQGSTYHIICVKPQRVKSSEIEKRVEKCLSDINNSISGYHESSILAKINRGEDLPLDSIFIETFYLSKKIWEESKGAFDPSASPLFDLWGFGFNNKENVTQAKIDSILQFVGMDLLSIEVSAKDSLPHLVKKDSRISLNFNAIGQGFTCDLVARELNKMGCSDYLVEVGREIVCKGESARGESWRVGLDKPYDGNFDEGNNLQEVISVTDKGIVTSGNYRQFYVENGQKYAHTINPLTGYPVTHNLLSATVIAKDGATADAYATWFMVIGEQSARKVLEERNDLEGYLIFGAQDSMQVWQTEGMVTEKTTNR